MEERERRVILAFATAATLAVGTDLPHALVGGGVGAVLGWLAATDLRTHRVPNAVVLPALGALTLILAGWAALADRSVGPALAGAGGIAFGLLLLSAVTRGSMGLGDVKAGALVGLWSGWLDPWAPMIALLAAFVGAGGVVLAGRAAGRLTLTDRVPFVPALTAGAVLATWWTRWGA